MTTTARIRSAAEQALPPPRPGRFRPLRAGIRNVWEYDDHEFWFEDGRLILRGPNTAGKSKALELLFPFVLDGETRPERLDPFGGRTKTMYWNLIEFDPQRTKAIGYCWAEFGRVDEDGEDRFVTVIAGMRAVRSAGKKVETWFAVTPLRVGADLDLAPDNDCRTAERLREAIDGQGQVNSSARDHRAAVDQALYGLGPDRYEALIHLLLQLRRPKLSEKLDVSRLAEILTEALPPLERRRIEDLAQAFSRLDADTEEIRSLDAALGELRAFLVDYKAYAEVHTRLRTDRVRNANYEFDKVTEIERLQGEERKAAEAALGEIERRRQQLELHVERLRGQLAGLDLSKVEAQAEVERRAEESRRSAGANRERAERDSRRAGEHRRAAAEAEDRAGRSHEEAERLVTQSAEVAGRAGLGVAQDAHTGQLRSEPERARTALEGTARRRLDLLRAVRSAAADSDAARARIEREEERHRDELERLEQARAASRRARSSAEVASEAYSDAVDSWHGSLGVPVRDRIEDQVLAELVRTGADSLGGAARALVLPADGDEAESRNLADRLTGPARDAVGAEGAALRSRVEQLRTELEEMGVRRDRIIAESEDAPPPAAGRPQDRPSGCAPLWECVDFADSLPAESRPGLEAALHAAGLLDALISPDGALLDPDTLDTVLTPGLLGSVTPGRVSSAQVELTLAAWLKPVPASPVAAQAVTAALSAVGVAPGNRLAHGTWVDVDGTWRSGVLAGRWSKGTAEFIGATARSHARARRLAELEEQMEVAGRTQQALADRAAAAVDLLRTLGAAAAAFPSPSVLRDAIREIARAGREEAAQREVTDAAAGRVAEARSRAAAVLAALAGAEDAAQCRAGDAEAQIDAVGDYRRALAEAVSSGIAARREREVADRAAVEAGTAEDEALASGAEADRAERLAEQAEGQADELRASIGADVEEILARKRYLEDQTREAGAERERLDRERDGARDRLARASEKLLGTESERARTEAERADALQALSRLAQTDLVTLAVGPVDHERDLSQVTAGLAFARTTRDRLRDVAVAPADQDSAANRVHNAFTRLRRSLERFDPHLDSSDGVSVCLMTLNGRPTKTSDLAAVLAESLERRREALTAEERELIERHLLTEVGSHLGERVHAGWALVRRMNEQLSAHPTRGEVVLGLRWEVAPDAGAGAEEAVRLLRRDVALLDNLERQRLAAFLHERVRMAREEDQATDVVERMAAALDYRYWHRFVITRRTNGTEERFSAKTQSAGSGGEQAKLAHLPLFAATGAYYSSAAPTAPHLLLLDEAFAGIDDDQRGDCMAMLVDLDLDVVLTNYAEWGCFPEVPAVAIYHLERTPGVLGVAALRFVWEGGALREDDPFLEWSTA